MRIIGSTKSEKITLLCWFTNELNINREIHCGSWKACHLSDFNSVVSWAIFRTLLPAKTWMNILPCIYIMANSTSTTLHCVGWQHWRVTTDAAAWWKVAVGYIVAKRWFLSWPGHSPSSRSLSHVSEFAPRYYYDVCHWQLSRNGGPEVLLKTCVAMKFVDDDDDGISECSSLCRSDYFQFRQLRPIVRSETEDAAKTFSHLDYCNRLPFGQPAAATPVGSERACPTSGTRTGRQEHTTNIGSKSAISLQRSQFALKFQVEGVTPTNHSFSDKTRLNDLSYGMKIWTDFSSPSSQSTSLTDRQTDSRTSFLRLDRHAFNAAR